VLPSDLDWFNAETVNAYEEIADDRTTAQVHPLHFTNAMAQLSEEAGAKFILGMVTDINCAVPSDGPKTENEDTSKIVPLSSFAGPVQRVVSVIYTDKATGEKKTMPCDTLVLAAGPWTPTLLPGLPMSSLRAHSVTIRPKKPVSAYCLFTEVTLPDHSHPDPTAQTTPPDNRPRRTRQNTATTTRTLSPEIYARPNNEIYICGRGDVDHPLPLTTDLVEVSSIACAELVTAASATSDEIRDGIVTGRRACYLPTLDVGGSGGPLIGETDVEGLILAAGHSCWGILNAPATGKVVSELILDGVVTCADVGSLDPRKIL
jgi:glycine/D-amino acid oxidase-like deaminating enzyme